MESNVGSVNAILGELSYLEKPIVLLMNKRDLCLPGAPPQEGALRISAKSGEGIPELLTLIERELWFHRPQEIASTPPA
jgi:50S ribosomal subunit-associated GTPase HflX